jgi:glucosamine-6-phosphate deaminase
MRLLVTHNLLGKWAAHYLSRKLQQFSANSTRPFVLGLPTGSTPLYMYQELVQLYRQGKISFKNVITFNMDEYVGLPQGHPQSYAHYMHTNFFDHVDIPKQNIHILDGNAKDLEAECNHFEQKIAACGGMDIIFGGVGEDGHIAFNEPGSSLNSETRVKTLNYSTIVANSRFFNHDLAQTPQLALTMGIKTILSSKEVVILAQGIKKARAVCQAIEGAISSICPITALQQHNKVVIACDDLATYELKVKTMRYFEDIHDEYSALLNQLTNNVSITAHKI